MSLLKKLLLLSTAFAVLASADVLAAKRDRLPADQAAGKGEAGEGEEIAETDVLVDPNTRPEKRGRRGALRNDYTNLDQLPYPILEQIFGFLNDQDQRQLRCVCLKMLPVKKSHDFMQRRAALAQFKDIQAQYDQDPNFHKPFYQSEYLIRLLLHVAKVGDVATTCCLLTAYPGLIHQANAFREFPLINAVRAGHTGVVQVLLEKGANPFSKTFHDSKLPREIASEKGFNEIVALLIEAEKQWPTKAYITA